MTELEELLNCFRFWNTAWERYDRGDKTMIGDKIIKPTSKEEFLKTLENKYKVIKK